MGDLKLAIRRPLAALGAVAGVIAAGIIMPSSCEFTQAQSDRLHVALPLAGPLVLALVAGWFARALKPRVLEKRRRWIALAVLMVIVGEALFNAVAGVTYNATDAPASFAIAWMYFMPLEIALLPIILWIVVAARAADRVRRGALLDGVARRQVWLVVLGCIAPVEALVFALHGRAVSWLAYGAWAFAAASIPAIAALALFDGRAARRFARAVEGTVPRDAREPLPTDGSLLDLGVGDEVHGPAPDAAAHPYRAGTEPATVIGSLEATRKALRRARVRDVLLFAVALMGVVATTYVLAHLPAPSGADKPLDFAPLFHC